MRSSEDFSLNGVLQDESSSENRLSTSDSNANLNNRQNKGAIPKTKASKALNVPRKILKLNNNVDDILIPKGSNDLTEIPEVLHLNGLTDPLSKVSENYLNDYKSVLYTNGANHCDSKGLLHEGQLTHTSNKQEINYSESLYNNALYEPSTSSNELDLDISLQIKLETESTDSEDNDLLSISDDGCIYTYKGDQIADLPSSFFSLDIPPPSPERIPQNRDQNASPEMDFLEMDFDPGPSGDADSDSQSNADLETTENLPQDPSFMPKEATDLKLFPEKPPNNDLTSYKATSAPEYSAPIPTTAASTSSTEREPVLADETEATETVTKNTNSTSSNNLKREPSSNVSRLTQRIRKMRMPWSCTLSQRTVRNSNLHSSKRVHNGHGELLLPHDMVLSPNKDLCFASEAVENDAQKSLRMEKVMIWSEYEASLNQFTQIGASACGATAVLNVLNALRLPVPSIEIVKEAVQTRLRANSSPLTEYLLSRSCAGSTHKDLIKGLHILSEGQVYARFFHMYPERIINLNTWLQFWMANGAVPIATLNLQKCASSVPDAWHHQMIFGIGPLGVCLTNPIECVHPSYLYSQLSSESVLLIRREDVLSRWNVATDLPQLMRLKDPRWSKMNVVGQVANMVRESMREKRPGFSVTSHIKIPAAYSSGITLVMRKTEPLYLLLKYCPELPLLSVDEEAVGY